MPESTDSTEAAAAVELTLDDGRRISVPTAIADQVRGVDADGDLLIPLGDPAKPIRHQDGTEYLIPLTSCCHATGKGAMTNTGVVCRGCYREVDPKYGDSGALAVRVTST